MEVVIFCGIQASGKSTFFIRKFFSSHVRISMDLLHTRNKELKFMELCLTMQQDFVIDNTNPTKAEREKYIRLARQYKFKVIGYYFQSKLDDAIIRNSQRIKKAYIPEIGIKATYNRLELPSMEEGFDELYYVEIEHNDFIIKAWKDEI